MVLKMSFCKLLHGIGSGNDGDLDTARSLYMKILCVRERPLFFVRQGKAPEEIPQNVAGSLGHVTTLLGTLCIGQINIFHWKIFRKREQKGQEI